MKKIIIELVAIVCALVLFLAVLPINMAQSEPPPSPVPAPCIYLVGPSGTGSETFYTNTTGIGSTFTITAWINTTYDESGWAAALYFNQTQLNVVSVAFTANDSSESQWFYDQGIYAPFTGVPPFMDNGEPARVNNIQGSISEPEEFGESAASPNINVHAAVATLFTITFEVMMVPTGSTSYLTSEVILDPINTCIFNLVGEPDGRASFGNFKYVLASGQSSTSVVCSSNPVAAGSSTVCTATVSGVDATGTITWSTNSSTGSFSQNVSTLSSSSVSTTYTDTTYGSVMITANYSGDLNNSPSSGDIILVVGQFSNFTITFGQLGVASDFKGTVVVIDGSDFNYSNLPVTFSWMNGSRHTFAFQSPLVAAANSEQYLWTNTTGLSTLQNDILTVTGIGSVTGDYSTQYYLTVTSAYGSPNPTSGWFDPGSVINASVNSPVSGGSGTLHICWGWTGTGSVPTFGPATFVVLTIVAPSSIMWDWKTQYEVTFSQTGVGTDYTGTVFLVDGTSYAGGDSPTFWWDSGSTHTFQFESPLIAGPGLKPYFWGSTTGLSTLQSGSITVTGPGTVTGNYVNNVHEVVVRGITTNTGLVYQGQTAYINITVSNVGDFPENVWVVAAYGTMTSSGIINAYLINNYPVSLAIGQTYTLMFEWNPVGIPCLTYRLVALALIPTGYHAISSGTITVRLMGDVNGDGFVNMRDIALIARNFGSTPTSPNWNPAADLNGDGKIDMKDIALVARNFGQHYP